MYRSATFWLLLVILLALLFAPLRIPYQLVSVGLVEPAEEWRLVQEGANSLSALHQNFKSGWVEKIGSWQFERGDLAGLQIRIQPDTFGRVICGDTIASLYSVEIQQQIVDLETQLQLAESAKQVAITGEKLPIVEEAASRLAFAREVLALRQREFDITEKLEKEGAVSTLDLTRAKNALDLATIDVQTAEKALAVANTGAKPESVQLSQTQISTLQKRLQFLKNRAASYYIVSPFDGVQVPLRETGQILVLQRLSEYILSIPVRAEQLIFIDDKVKITVRDRTTGKTYSARFLNKAHQTQIVGGKVVGFIKALVLPDNFNDRLTLGLTAECTLTCDSLTLRQYLSRILHFDVKN